MDEISRTRNRFACYLLYDRTSSNSNIMSSIVEENIMDLAYKINVHWSEGQLKSHILPRVYTVI